MDFTNSSQTFMVDILHEEVDAHTMGEVSIMVEAVEGETAGEKGVTTEDLLPQEEVAMVSDCNIQTNMSALGDFSVVFCHSFTLIGSIFSHQTITESLSHHQKIGLNFCRRMTALKGNHCWRSWTFSLWTLNSNLSYCWSYISRNVSFLSRIFSCRWSILQIVRVLDYSGNNHFHFRRILQHF